MASVCVQHFESLYSPDFHSLATAYPPVENQTGDIIFIPTKVTVIGSVHRVSYRDERQLMRALSIALVTLISAIVWLKGGGFMYYIPLYLSLIPILYWFSKIGMAFAISKFSQVESICFTYKDKKIKPKIKHVKKDEDLLVATIDFLKKTENGGFKHDS